MPACSASCVLWNATSLAVEIDLTGVRMVRARQNVDKSRFARAVFAHQGEDLALLDVQRDVGERLDAGERLGDSFDA